MMNRDLRSTRIAGCLLLFFALFAVVQSLHAQPVAITFSSVPCDSTACDSLTLSNPDPTPADLIVLDMRDSTSFAVSWTRTLPQTISAGGSLTLPICFSPERRGNISDSLLIVLRRSLSNDTVRVRISGKGLGPLIDAVPNVLNFPKTNPGNTSTLKMKIYNNGERPYELTALNLTIPPPFTLLTPLPIMIAPGDSTEIEVQFEPQENGIYSKQVDLPVGCNTQLQLGFNGVTDLIGTGAVLRISKTGFNPVNDEQIPCDSVRCTNMTLSNVGNAPLIIEGISWLIGSLGYTIANPPAVPFIIPPQGQRDLEICISSKQRGTLRDTLEIISNTRSSIAFGMVIDRSYSMRLPMDCNGVPSTRLDQAKLQAKNFIGRTILYLPQIGVQDQLAICTYTTYQFSQRALIEDIFPLTQITDAQRAASQATIDNINLGDGTPTGAGLLHMIDVISNSPLKNRVIVLLTDGVPSGNDSIVNPISQIISRARAAGIRIFTIGMNITDPVGRTYVKAVADGTGGQSFEAADADCGSLQQAFEAITDIVSRGGKTIEPFRIKIQSPFLVTLRDVKFDSVHVGDTICRTITITNAGEGTAIVDSANFFDMFGVDTDEFYMPSGMQFPILIPESGQVNLLICFNPKRIRTREGEARFYYNDCGAVPTSARLTGAAWAKANLRITDERIGLPGQTVTMPVYADTSLTEYSVNTIVYTVRWNKTMLDLRGVHPGGSAGASSVTISKPVQFGDHEATVEITATGSNMQGAGELAQLDFFVLRGDSLGSIVELTQGSFEDNNPRPVLVNRGIIGLDSTCFRDNKPLTRVNAAKLSLGNASPNPIRGAAARLPVQAEAPTEVTIEVFNNEGQRVSEPRRYTVAAGSGALEINVAGLASGSYYAMVRTAEGASLFRQLLLVR